MILPQRILHSRHLRAIALGLVLLVFPGAVSHGATLAVPPPPPTGHTLDQLREMMESRTRTGVGMDAIPALSRPEYLSVSDASLSMEHDETVFIVEYPTGLVRIFPQRIMVWHEVVNDVLPDPSGAVIRKDTPLSALDAFTITYCPLTGSVNAFHGVAGRYPTTFGVTGELYNSNTLLYDRATRSTWVQLTLTAIDGPLAGKRLSPIQVLWSSWRGAMQRFPDAQVLSRSTGYRRSYGRDPYGSYVRHGNYYDDLRILFPLSRLDNRLPPKKAVLGLEIEGMHGAVDKAAVMEARVVNMALGLTPLVAVHDQTLGTVRIFDPRLPETDGGETEELRFELFENKIIDANTRSEWDEEGNCIYGRLRGKKLRPVFSMDSMWFAWAAFYPQSVILPEKSFERPVPGQW